MNLKNSEIRTLPKVKSYASRSTWDNAFSDQYGAFHVAANYAGVVPPFPVSVMWQHGCFGPWNQIYPGTLLYHSPKIGEIPAFVARKDEKIFIESFGIKNCEAIGLPFIYSELPKVEKIKNSLLVMPNHSLNGIDSFRNKQQIKTYVSQIASLKKYFFNITVCLHIADMTMKNYIDEFASFGIPVVLGAHNSDRNSLLRTKMLFNLFEYVTTNAWGSHVAYALSQGAKCSIWGEEVLHDTGILMKYDIGVKDETVNVDLVKNRNEYLQELFLHPAEGIINRDMGNFLIGMENKKSPKELKDLLGWSNISMSFRASYVIKYVFIRNLKRLLNIIGKRIRFQGL